MRRSPSIYRHFDDQGCLLYVGYSLSPIARQINHETSAPWYTEISRIEIEWFETAREAAQAEVDAIRAESPKYNVAIPVIPSGDPQNIKYSGLGRPSTYKEPQGDQRIMAIEWWGGKLHTDDVRKLIGQMTGTPEPSRGLVVEWFGNRPKCEGRMRKTRSDKGKNSKEPKT